MCPELIPPVNGVIEYSINVTLVIAEYSCKIGYSLHGDVQRFCNDSGKWTGTVPGCVNNGMSIYVYEAWKNFYLY